MEYYKLVNKIPVPCTMIEWAQAYDFGNKKDRIIKQEYVRAKGRKSLISTVFLGLDHNFNFNRKSSNR